MADILYVYKTSIYANLTNKCPCRCTFCIRNNSQATRSLYSVATANRLRLLTICLKPQNM